MSREILDIIRVSDCGHRLMINFSWYIVLKKLNQLKSNSGGGPDNLPPEFLKKTSKFIFKPLAYMFETFLINACVPPIWRRATVRPIFKNGNPSDVQNCWPISFTCTCCKLMESIISYQLQCYFRSKNHFYFSFYSVHDEINSVLVQFLFFWQQSF